jgi:hypothetical protein
MSWKRSAAVPDARRRADGSLRAEPPPQAPSTTRTKRRISDAQTIAQLVLAGSDFSQPHPVEFLPVPADAGRRRRVGGSLRADVDAVEVRPAAKGSEWLCLARKSFVPTLPEIRAMRVRMRPSRASTAAIRRLGGRGRAPEVNRERLRPTAFPPRTRRGSAGARS